MASFLLFVGVVGVCLLMLWASHKMEPHWVSKDGERMICFGQGLQRGGQTIGRWRELRINKVREDTVEVRPRRGSLSNGSSTGAAGLLKRRVPKASYWTVAGPVETPLRNRVMYILDGNNEPDLPDLIAIRLPAKSRAIPMLEAMTNNAARNRSASSTRASTTGAPSRESARSEARPDPG